ncbi:MAG: glycosyltransferase family 4 protein, partial [Patescibacteria group bacterium]
ENNFRYYSQYFEEVRVFAYGQFNEWVLPRVKVLPNRFRLPRYLYAFIIPIIHKSEISNAAVLRGMQLTGGIPACLAKFLYRIPVVVNYGYDYVKVALVEGKVIRAWLLKVLTLLLLPCSDKVIITNQELARQLIGVPKNKIHLIPNGIDTVVFRPQRMRKLFDIIYVGRFEVQKNLKLLLTAAAKVKPYPKILLIGSGSLKNNLLNLADALKLNLTIYDSVSHKNLPYYLNQSRMFVLPSLIEGNPKALLEAMSCGLPVIGTGVEGIKDIITDSLNGLIAESTAKKLAYAIKKLSSNIFLQKSLGEQARKTILRQYNAKMIWEKELTILTLLARN